MSERFFDVWCIDDHEKYHVIADKITGIRETHTRAAGVEEVGSKGTPCRVIHAGDLEIYTTLTVDDIKDRINKCLE